MSRTNREGSFRGQRSPTSWLPRTDGRSRVKEIRNKIKRIDMPFVLEKIYNISVCYYCYYIVPIYYNCDLIWVRANIITFTRNTYCLFKRPWHFIYIFYNFFYKNRNLYTSLTPRPVDNKLFFLFVSTHFYSIKYI